MNQIHLSVETVNAVLNYLTQRPYKEVAEIIGTVISEANNAVDTPIEDEK